MIGSKIGTGSRGGVPIMIEFRREIYDQLLKWKNRNDGKVLEIKGARQVGKTFIIQKFARENYSKVIYINMAQSSGRDFLECLDKAEEWEIGMPRNEHPLHDAFSYFSPEFSDNEDTVVLIDEIQESARIYSCIRQFAREFRAHFIVTGSYLGRILEKEFFPTCR